MGTIYELLGSLYGSNLGDYLFGFNCDTEAFDNPNLYNTIGTVTIGMAVAIAAVFYIAINSPRFNHKSHWFIFMAIAIVAGFGFGFWYTVSDFNNGLICDTLMYERDEEGNILADLILKQDCVMFGLANAIISALVYTIASIGLKYLPFCRNCKRVPF